MKKYVFIILTIFFIIIFGVIVGIKTEYTKGEKISGNRFSVSEDISTNMMEINFAENEVNIDGDYLFNECDGVIGLIEIPKISLKEYVKDGTTNDVIDYYIGHFENTNNWNGNVAVCAHNNGYPMNHFSRLNELVVGDEVTYITRCGIRIYCVCQITEIDETNLEVLDESLDNRLTMITCVPKRPSKRLCVYAIEKEEYNEKNTFIDYIDNNDIVC